MEQNEQRPKKDARITEVDIMEAALRAMLVGLPLDKLLILIREFDALLEDSAD